MTHPTLPAPEHAHSGGSAGGPGENSASCVCGVTFDGFDTRREAKTLLDQHIKDETKAKPVALLEAGDWIDLTSLNEDYVEGPALVRYVETYEEISYRKLYTMVVLGGGFDPMPSSYRWPAEKRARLLTDAEIEKVKAEERREQLARQFEQLAEMARGGKVPFPDHESLHFTLETRAEVESVATALGLQAGKRWDDGLQVSWPQGQQPYDDGLYVLWHTSEKPSAEPKPVLVLDPERGHVPADDLGFDYSRQDADPQVIRPHSPRVPLHTGAVVDGGKLVDETPAETRFPLVHLSLRGRSRCGMSAEEIASTSHGDSTTISPVEVTCQDCREAANLLPVEEIKQALADSKALDETPAPASGLTVEADLSRGPLAGTTPVVTYCSFGHGQTDPDSGQKLIDHYVTVVAPTYEECRAAMFASRFGRAWSFDYLAGRAKTTEAVSEWTEHEVIVAPGTDPVLAEVALKAAGDLLVAEAS